MAVNIGPKIGIDGEAEFRRTINDINQSLRTFGTELKMIGAQMGNTTSKEALLTQKNKALSTSISQQKQIIAELEYGLKEASAKYGENSSQALRWQQALNGAKTKLAQMESELKKVNIELKVAAIEESKWGKLNTTFGKMTPVLDNVANRFMKITKYMTGMATGLLTMGMYKAFNKLENLGEVQTIFRGIGVQGEKLETTMTAITNSVTGTKYALTDMATVGKGAYASLSNEGIGMEDYLTRVADLASYTGKGVSEMGTLMNKALVKGHIDARLLNSMLANGLPIIDDLAAAYGKTKEEITDMVSRGEIGIQEIMKATEKYAGLAQKTAFSTVSGAVTIIGQRWTAMSASFLDGVYGPLKSSLISLSDYMQDHMDTVKQLGESFGVAIKAVIEFVKNGEVSEKTLGKMDGAAQKFYGVLQPIVGTIASIVKWFMNLSSTGKKVVVAFALLTGPLLKVVSGFMKAYMNAYKFYIQLVKTGQAAKIMTVVKTAINGIKAAASGAGRALAVMGKFLIGNPWILAVAGIVALVSALGILSAKGVDVQGKIQQFTDTVVEKIQGIADAAPQMIEAGVQILQSLIQGMVENMPMIVEAMLTVAQTMLQGITSALPALLQCGLQIITTIIQGLVQNLPMIIQSAVTIFTTFLNGLVQNLPMLISAGISMIPSIVQGLVQAIPTLVAAAPKIIGAIVSAIINLGGQLITSGLSIMKSLASGIINGIKHPKESVKQIKDKIKEWFRDLDLAKIGKNIVQGLANGIANAASFVKDAVKGVINKAKEQAKKSSDSHSPSRWFDREIGQMIGAGIVIGIQKSANNIATATRTVIDNAKLAAQTSMSDGLALAIQDAMVKAGDVAVTAQSNVSSNIDYERIEAAMEGAAIVLDGRVVGRWMRGKGVVFA